MGRRSGHRPEAYGCEYWTGDRDPLYMGTCPVCEPDPDSAAAEQLIRLEDDTEPPVWSTRRLALVALLVVLAAYGLFQVFISLVVWAESIDLIQSS